MTKNVIRKAVIPVAGLGTRMLPATKAIPKEMLTVVDKPAIQYVVDEAVAAGIRDIVLVNHSSKSAIENHFDLNPELEAQLIEKKRDDLLSQLRDTLPSGVSIISVRQGRALGLGHAVACAECVVGDEPFVVMLPDVLIDNDVCGSDLIAMLDRYRQSGFPQIMMEKVADDQVEKYGIADLLGATLRAGMSSPINALVEKPAIDVAPSNWAVVGRYILPPEVFSLLRVTKPGAGGEIQLTDAIARLMNQFTVEAYGMEGETFDCGSKLGYLEAIFHYALKHPEIGDSARKLLIRYCKDMES